MIDSECRPKFRELVNEFTRMARDPTRFVVIEDEELMAQASPLTSQFYSALLQEVGMDDLVDAEEYLVPHQGFFGSEETTSIAETQIDQAFPEDAHAADSMLARTLSQRSGGSGSDAFSEGEYVFEPPLPRESRENSLLQRYSEDPVHPGEEEVDGGGGLQADGCVSPGIFTHPPEYVNQREGGSSRSPVKPTRASVSTLERAKGQLSRNGLVRERRSPPTVAALDNPDYLPPPGLQQTNCYPQAFDNPYYWNHELDASRAAGESNPGHRGFTTPTAENPEYLGLEEASIRPWDVTL
ncbi:hypothetical protein FKM82_027894 [Ascaphus truei]